MCRAPLFAVLAATAALIAPAAAQAGNEGAPWSSPAYLSVAGASDTAEGPSLAMLDDGSLVATWNQNTGGGWFPELASEPFATGAWSQPTALSATAISPPLDNIGGVRTAVTTSGKFVSAWLAPNPSTSGQNDVDGAVGSVTPRNAPGFSPYTFAAYSPAGGSELVYTPQVAMSSDGTGTVEHGIANVIPSAGTYMGLIGLAGGTPTGTAGTPQAAFKYNPADGNNDYDKYVPALGTSGLNSAWDASLSDSEALVGTNSGLFAQLYTTSNPSG